MKGKLANPELRAQIDRDLAKAQALRDELKAYTCLAIADRVGVSEECIKQYKQKKTYSK